MSSFNSTSSQIPFTTQGLESHSEPNWQSVSDQHEALPSILKDWLLDAGSLTEKLKQQSDQQFRVELLHQSIERARPSEYKALSLGEDDRTVVREVILYGHNIPWVYARTVIPLSTLEGPLSHFHQLGNRPLGEVLFSDSSVKRLGLELAEIHPRFLPKSISQKESAWGRRSVFLLKDKPLLVCEVFLQNLINPA